MRERDRIYNVLFLCTGNSARSIMAEAILNRDGAGRFRAFSAGSMPKGAVHPMALKVLRAFGYGNSGYRSKAWDEFALPDAPAMDFVFTVCDNAAGEVCPVWPGQPMTAHWGIEDPAAAIGTEIEIERAFSLAARYLKNRIALFLNLPLHSIGAMSLRGQLDEIGRSAGATALSLEPIAGTSPELRATLAAESLPVEDLAESGRCFFRIKRGHGTIGYGGYELHGRHALLRSVVVLPAERRRGSGRAATELLLGAARDAGGQDAYVLTTDAAPFFENAGFRRVERTAAPAEILATQEAAKLCPASAVLLMRSLDATPS